jgi:hypothetical protein
MKTMKALLATQVPRIVSGEVQGQVLSAGRFKCTDPDLCRTSAANMPGAVLITDTETLSPIDSKLHQLLGDRGDPLDQTASTRKLLQKARYVNDRTIGYAKGRLRYSNDTQAYERTVSICSLLPNRRGTATPRDLLTYSEADGLIHYLPPSVELGHDVQIGTTYDYPVYGALGLISGYKLRRLTSVEVCIPGEPIEASMPSITRALGHLAGNN